jgi:hypothetical protein
MPDAAAGSHPFETAGGEEQAPTQVNVVLNWFEELKRLVPVPK